MILKTKVSLSTVYAIGKEEFNLRKLVKQDDETDDYVDFNLNLLYVCHYYKSIDGNTVVVLNTQEHLKLKEKFEFFEKLMFLASPLRQIELVSPYGAIHQRNLNVNNEIVSQIISLE